MYVSFHMEGGQLYKREAEREKNSWRPINQKRKRVGKSDERTEIPAVYI